MRMRVRGRHSSSYSSSPFSSSSFSSSSSSSSEARIPSTNVATPPSRQPKGKETQHPRTIFSGIQPTGVPHLGNYLGAIQNWIRLQEDPWAVLGEQQPNPTAASASGSPPSPPPRIFYSIVGLHAITMPQDPVKLRNEKRDALACLLACGLGSGGLGPSGKSENEKPKSTLFFQEEVPEHAELAWYLNTLTSVGKLQRMTTWKVSVCCRFLILIIIIWFLASVDVSGDSLERLALARCEN